MSYPGNSTLTEDTQQRLLKTFEQTLDLAARGSAQEALLGCDFILRMDPQFEPARTLLNRLNASIGAITVDDLRGTPAAAAPPPPAPAPIPASPAATPVVPPREELSFADLDDFGAGDLSARLSDSAGTTAAATRAAMTAAARERRFQDVIAAGERDPGAVAADPELGNLAQAAQAHLEAEPYVAKFLSAAREAAHSGQILDAERWLQKARALDQEHPEIAAIAAQLESPPEQEALPSLTFDEPLGDLTSFEAGPDWGDLEPLAPPAAAGVGAAASAAGGDSDRRIAELIAEGEAAFARGEHQSAIDAWSRIFLIDIDNEEASRCIDRARGLKAEAERKLEETFHEATSHLDAGRVTEARAALERVLQIQPNHLDAREMLAQLDSPNANAREIRARVDPAAAIPLKEEILVPPEPGTPLPAPAIRPPVAASPGRRFLLIGGAALALVLAAGAVVWTQRERFFPNSQPAPATAPAPDPVARATALHEKGRTAVAIAQLRRLPPEDPQYQQAQALIEQWETVAAPQPSAPPAAQTARRDALVTAARAAAAAGDRLRARSLYEQAAAVSPLTPEAEAQRAELDAALAPFQAQVDLFRQGDWEFALPALWRLHEAEPGNRDVTRLLVDAYHNLGVRALQQGAVGEAATQFKEAAALAPADDDLARLARFAQAYSSRSQDLLYRTYVKYLPLREL